MALASAENIEAPGLEERLRPGQTAAAAEM